MHAHRSSMNHFHAQPIRRCTRFPPSYLSKDSSFDDKYFPVTYARITHRRVPVLPLLPFDPRFPIRVQHFRDIFAGRFRRSRKNVVPLETVESKEEEKGRGGGCGKADRAMIVAPFSPISPFSRPIFRIRTESWAGLVDPLTGASAPSSPRLFIPLPAAFPRSSVVPSYLILEQANAR